MIFANGTFTPDSRIGPGLLRALDAAVDRAAGKLGLIDLMDGALAGPSGPDLIFAMRETLPSGADQRIVRELLDILAPPITPGTAPTFDGSREAFTAEALTALDELQAELATLEEGSADVGLELLLACVLEHVGDEVREALKLDSTRAAELMRQRAALRTRPARALFLEDTGRLRSEEFSNDARSVLEEAARWAGELGSEHALPPHLFLALLAETDGVLERGVRLNAPPGTGPAKLREHLSSVFSMGPRRPQIELEHDSVGKSLHAVLRAAASSADALGVEQLDPIHLLSALLRRPAPQLAAGLEDLSLDVAKLRAFVEQELRSGKTTGASDSAFRLPPNLLPSEDYTYAARQGGMAPALGVDAYLDPMERALYRKAGSHVLVVGENGIGRTTLVRELARRAAQGDIDFLKRKRFLRVECGNVETRESAAMLQAVLAHVGGRSDVILCLDDIGALMRSENGGTNTVMLRSALSSERVRLVGTLSGTDYEDLFAGDHALAKFFTLVTLEEPSVETAKAIVERQAVRLEHEFQLEIDDEAVARAVVLPSEYMMSERLPTKSLRILRRVCEDVDFDRSQRGASSARVTPAHVIRAISELTGVPEDTLAGVSDTANYEALLGQMVLGQDSAVQAMAADLRLIKAGRKSAGGPASVVLFAGLTGTGKTELAKAVAKLYSASKRLQTYTMGNFTEPHSVAGLIGSPVGYHGHDQGGPLINALNSDPFGVFLLDEAEKAHPNVWKPFLNLFDEGWIVDQRGVKGFADRSIFILTSNAGAEVVSHMAAAGRPMEEIIETAKQELSKVRSTHGDLPVFPPEFLARLDRVIIFNPLDAEAMHGITELAVNRQVNVYHERFEKELRVDAALTKRIGELAHAANIRADNKEGGRVANRLVRQFVSDEIQEAERKDPSSYSKCSVISVGVDLLHPGSGTSSPNVTVEFAEVPEPTLQTRAQRSIESLTNWFDAKGSGISERLTLRMESIEAELKAGDPNLDTTFLDEVRAELAEVGRQSHEKVRGAVERLEVVLRELAKGDA